MKKKALLLTVMLLFTVFVSAAASANTSKEQAHIYTMDDIKVVDGEFTKAELEDVVTYLNGEQVSQTKNLLCTVFGHKLEYTGTIYSVDHKVYAAQPRCVEHIYKVYTCTRCGHKEYELISSVRIVCCE